MPRQKPFDKKTATTFALVHRPQNDPLIHDSDAPSQVFTEIAGPSERTKKSKIKQRGDLEEEFGLSGAVRANEGEAAEYGIFYDDSSYDYMQHMRDLGGGTEAVWVEAATDPQQKKKDKKKQNLEDALRESSLDDDGLTSESGVSWVGSHRWGKQTDTSYQSQQDIPDSIAGFRPDMDPRLREVLEALDDDEYVSDDENVFGELTGEGNEEIDEEEWEVSAQDEEDGWESDDTTKPMKEYDIDKHDFDGIETVPLRNGTTSTPTFAEDIPDSNEDGAWFERFAKTKSELSDAALDPLGSTKAEVKQFDTSSAAFSSASQFAKRKKRKGALTSDTGFSMSSSALARTETMSIMDSRFDKYEKEYMDDLQEEDEIDDNISLASGMTSKTGASKYSAFGGSQAPDEPTNVPANFDNVLDDFLNSSGGGIGKKKKGSSRGRTGAQSGMAQLDEVRHGLGPARLSARNKTTQRV